jgi:DNA recombination protein RmuC
MLEIIAVATSFLLLVFLAGLVWRLPSREQYTTMVSGISALKEGVERLERVFRDEMGRNRDESSVAARLTREEISTNLSASSQSLASRVSEIAGLQGSQMETFSGQVVQLTRIVDEKMEAVRESVDQRLRSLQQDNERKLEQMRETVDEKLHATLERRLGESFRQVSERLEQVAQGLGEMQTLAAGVGDLKKVLTNIKSRGTWGEIQLGSLLEQILAPEQYEKNVATRAGSNDRVEFAIRLPGRDQADGDPVWLPIDAKFPQEDYLRLLDAQDKADPLAVEDAAKGLESRIRQEGKTIRDKYLDPPRTTDFAIMFLPTEGLYAEVTRRAGLCEQLQREFRVTVAGPNTLVAFLNSLQMGFRTLAIEKRTSEVWSLLGAVKTEFGRFGEILDRTRKKLEEASNTIDSAATRSRAIERKLRTVQELPAGETARLLGSPGEASDDDESLK